MAGIPQSIIDIGREKKTITFNEWCSHKSLYDFAFG